MRKVRERNYWLKKAERYPTGDVARSRAMELRADGHIEHVHMDRVDDAYLVTYSVPKWYMEQAQKAGVKI